MKNRIIMQSALPVLILLFLGCKSPEKEREKEPGKQPEEQPAQLNKLEGKYHYLNCTREDFLNLKIRNGGIGAGNRGRSALFLKNVIENGDLTLHGWQFKKNNNNQAFEDTPNIKFTVGKDTSIAFGNGSYLGDLILSKKHIRDVQDFLLKPANQKYKYVVLVPVKYNGNPNEIGYEIRVSEEVFSLANFGKVMLEPLPTAKYANPIPPGGGSALDEE